MMKIPYYTTAAGALAAAQAIVATAEAPWRCGRCRATPEPCHRAGVRRLRAPVVDPDKYSLKALLRKIVNRVPYR